MQTRTLFRVVAIALTGAAMIGQPRASADKVNRDRADGEKLNVDSTPSFFINGRKFHGPPTFEEFKDWIEEELNK